MCMVLKHLNTVVINAGKKEKRVITFARRAVRKTFVKTGKRKIKGI